MKEWWLALRNRFKDLGSLVQISRIAGAKTTKSISRHIIQKKSGFEELRADLMLTGFEELIPGLHLKQV